ncbi:M48 family metalloprotease [Undibacterium arcticum]|uniref:M48 family metalloprotease n=1 Tax=Undibacterium arcticum TaxID=1762892 RepID=A0ABV7EWV6_9BURK
MKPLSRLLRTTLLAVLCGLPLATAPAISAAQGHPNLPNLGDTEREELSPLLERKLGDEIMRDIRRDRDYLDDAPLLEYLNNFGSGLLAVRPDVRGEAGYDFFFFAVRDPALNAFALPGGFIAVHSGLILAAQTESELASVMAHEIGHVAQRHIARMLGKRHQDALIPLASAVLAILSARANNGGDAPMAILAGGQGLALQRQLNFSRDAEREADRVGFQILGEAGFDTSGMVAFFGRLQTAARSYSDAVPPFLLTHPLTTERIADIQARIRSQRYKQRADSLDFHLIRARARILQDGSPQALRDAAAVFDNQLAQKIRTQTAAAQYGLALVALRQGAYDKAQSLLRQGRTSAAAGQGASSNAIFANLSIEIKLAAAHAADAVEEAETARTQFPLSRGLAYQYAQALTAAGRLDDATRFLRDQTQLYRQEPKLYEQLASIYAAQGKQAQQHMALAESYALAGTLPSALEQLSIARRAPDASFYDQAVIDAREREMKAKRKEELQDKKKD